MIKEKRNQYRFWHSPVFLGVFLLILVFFGYRMMYLVKINNETIKKKNLAMEERDSLLKMETSLERDLLKIETEEGKEKIIRDKYKVAKEGEKIVTIVDNEESIEREDKIKHGFWNWLKGVFTNK